MSWDDQVDDLNRSVVEELGGKTIIYTRAGGGPPFTIEAIQVDPQAHEATSPGVVAMLWINAADFPAPPPARGDLVTMSGRDYYVLQVSADDGGGYDVALNQRK